MSPTSQSAKAQSRWLRPFITIAIILSVLVVSIVGLFVWIVISSNRPFRHSEAALRAEFAQLTANSGVTTRPTYVSGSCFDNCPVLQATYAMQSETAQMAIDQLQHQAIARGYHQEYFLPGPNWSYGATQGRFELTASATSSPADSHLPTRISLQLLDHGEK